MKKLTNKNNTDISDIIYNYSYNFEKSCNDLKKALFSFLKGYGVGSIVVVFLSLLTGATFLTSMLYAIYLFFNLSIFTSLSLPIIWHISFKILKKTSSKKIDEVIDVLEENDLNISKNDLEKSDVMSLSNTVTNGRRKVVNVVKINKKDKLKFLKQVTITYRDGFKHKTDRNLYLLNEEEYNKDIGKEENSKRLSKIMKSF